MKSQIITLAIMFIGITMYAQNNNNYEYDNLNRLKKVTFPNEVVYDYSYDQLGNRTVKVINAAAAQYPDLLVQNQSLSQTTMAAGANINANINVSNTGTGSANGHYVKCYLSSNQTYEHGIDVEVGSSYNGAIAAATNVLVNVNINIPVGTTPGNWYVLFFADATGYVAETNENNNIVSLPIVIVNCTNIQASSTITHASCGLNNGSVIVTPSGGYQPYTYQWSSGQTTATANNLAGNTYYVTITDFYGCIKTTSATVNIIVPPSITLSSTNATCGNSNGSALATVIGGTSPYTYIWSNGQTSSSINNVAAGNYSVTVTDANACNINGNVAVNTPANIAVVLYPTQPNCGSNNGVISSLVSGGTQPYTFLWSNGQTGQSANDLYAGNYSLTVTDANNCQFTTSQQLESFNNMSLSISSTNATCGNPNGTATVTASNGTAPYTYIWGDSQTGQSATNLSQGTYNVTVTDENNCVAISYATVNAIPPPSVSLYSTQTSCTSNTGSITANVSNGTSPFTYLWSNDGTSQSINNLGIGTYSVTVYDANNCTTQSSTTVQYENNGSTQLTVSLGDDIDACENENIALDAGAGFASYLWSNGDNSQILNLSYLNPGIHQYSVTVFACGNYSTDTINITIEPVPDGGNVITGLTSVCQGENSITYTVFPIDNADTYVWTLPDGTYGNSTSNSIDVDFSLTASSGNIIVAGVNLCGMGQESSLSILVKEKPAAPSIELNGTVLLSYSPVGNQWYLNSNPIQDAINQYYIPVVSGDYYSIVTIDECSSDPSSVINVVLTSLEDLEGSQGLRVYPNPVKNELIIELDGNSSLLNYEIIDIIGQVIYSGQIVEKASVQTAQFAPGIYLVKLENGKTFDFKKIIKE